MKPMAILLSTVSYPVLNLSMAIHDDIKMRQDKRFQQKMNTFNKNRLRQIMRERPYQGVFS